MMLSIINSQRDGERTLIFGEIGKLVNSHLALQLCSRSPARVSGLARTHKRTTVRTCFVRPGLRCSHWCYVANAISWGALGPQMFGPKGVYHMVPISLAIGLVLPFPFWIAVSIPPLSCLDRHCR